MENNNDLNLMVNNLIKSIFSDALGVSLKNPANAAFFVRVAMAQKKAASIRQKNEDQGLHVPPVLILSVTNKCNLHCVGCYSRLVPREQKPELSAANLTSVLQQASELGVSIVLIVGLHILKIIFDSNLFNENILFLLLYFILEISFQDLIFCFYLILFSPF